MESLWDLPKEVWLGAIALKPDLLAVYLGFA